MLAVDTQRFTPPVLQCEQNHQSLQCRLIDWIAEAQAVECCDRFNERFSFKTKICQSKEHLGPLLLQNITAL